MSSPNFNEALFSDYFNDTHSQNGEDGVINEIFNRLGWDNLSGWVAEFGAWDGKHLSNTFKLVEERNFNSVYIEGDKKRYADLIKTAECFSNVQALFAMVASESVSENSLDNLLGKTNIPTDFDLLSIDIDSFDLDIWESLDNYNPKVVVIEVNSGIMPGILSRHNSLHDGNSFSSTLLVAERKTIR